MLETVAGPVAEVPRTAPEPPPEPVTPGRREEQRHPGTHQSADEHPGHKSGYAAVGALDGIGLRVVHGVLSGVAHRPLLLNVALVTGYLPLLLTLSLTGQSVNHCDIVAFPDGPATIEHVPPAHVRAL
jgi:hypothetical protein